MSNWSTFEDDVRSNARPRGPRCSVGVMLDSLPQGNRDILNEVLEDRSLAVPAVHRALQERVGDEAPSPWSLANHRRGKCACQR